MKIQNDSKINILETQLNNLQNMILNISNVIGINNKNTIFNIVLKEFQP